MRKLPECTADVDQVSQGGSQSGRIKRDASEIEERLKGTQRNEGNSIGKQKDIKRETKRKATINQR